MGDFLSEGQGVQGRWPTASANLSDWGWPMDRKPLLSRELLAGRVQRHSKGILRGTCAPGAAGCPLQKARKKSWLRRYPAYAEFRGARNLAAEMFEQRPIQLLQPDWNPPPPVGPMSGLLVTMAAFDEALFERSA